MTRRTLALGGTLAMATLLGVAGTQAQAAGPVKAAVEIASPAAPGEVKGIKVQPDLAADCSSLKAIAESVTRGCKNNDEKAIAVYNFMQISHYHHSYPNEAGGVPVLKEINCYGWSLCGGLHSEQSAIWRELGWEWRFVGWSNPGHTTVEAQYDGRWHYVDIFLKFYAWMPDGKGGRTIAGEDDLNKDPQELIVKAFTLDKGRGVVYANDNAFVMNGEQANWKAPAFLVCGDTIDGVVRGLANHKGHVRAEGWAGINHATGNYSTDVNLAPGFSLENSWDPQPDAWYWAGRSKAPTHSCPRHKDTINSPGYGHVLEPYINSKPARSYANGSLTFAPDFANGADCLNSFVSVENVKFANKALTPAESGKPASVVFSLKSPYILTMASGEAAGADTVEVSVDGGKTYKPAAITNFSEAVKGKLAALVRIGIKEPLTSLKVRAVVQNNPGALPYLSPGKNRVTVAVDDPKALGANKLVVTYAYRLGSRTRSFDKLCDQGKEIARQTGAKWSDDITCVQKTFTSKELPATFDIDCPTPKGQYPVYPRMLFVRREALAPGSAPQPLPPGAVEAKAGAGDELAVLPNPFLIGTEKPEAVKPVEVKTTRIPLTSVQYANVKGEVGETGTLRWPNAQDSENTGIASAQYFTGDLKDLPAKGIKGARLVLPVKLGHNKAPGKLGVVFLSSPVEKGKAADVKALAELAGTAVVPKQPADKPVYDPPLAVSIDVTRGIKAVATGESKFNGLAVRIVRDRSVDDGYSVKCELAPGGGVLEVDTAVK